MNTRTLLLATAAGIALALAAPQADAKVFRAAFASEAATLDPHAQNALINSILLEQIYDTLATRDKDLKVVPGLAERWEQAEPKRWRFFLRRNVKFHDGAAFTADDAVFSIKRAMAPTSNFGIYIDSVEDAVKVDDVTIDIVTKVADPIIPDKFTRLFIMSKAWAEANRSVQPQNYGAKEETYASRNTNGTGPFKLLRRDPDVRTIMVRNENYWGPFEGNVTEYHSIPLPSDQTRVAALLSREVDFIHTVPPQDLARLRAQSTLKLIEGQENRTLFLGMDQRSNELKYANTPGKNPFKDIRVRQAVAHGVDMNVIRTRVMRGQAVITGSMWTQYVNGYSEDNNSRLAYDRDKAKKLLADAGYPNGFKVQLDCPRGAYESVCESLPTMLAPIGLELTLNLLPPAQTWPKIINNDTSFYALSWGVPTFDALYTLRGIMMTREKVGGSSWNPGYSNPNVDALIEKAQFETDQDKRRGFMRDAHKLHNEDLGHIPLQHMMIPWVMQSNVTLVHRADNFLLVKWVKVD
jgi:peptide/nickel transport system substrate-binding protein